MTGAVLPRFSILKDGRWGRGVTSGTRVGVGFLGGSNAALANRFLSADILASYHSVSPRYLTRRYIARLCFVH